MDNLIFSSGYGYPPHYLKAFLKSISRNMKSADVILFYHDLSKQTVSHLREYLERIQIVKPCDHSVRQAINSLPRGRILASRLIHQLRRKVINQPYSYLLTGIYHVHFARYFWVVDYCDRVDIRQYRRVMLCDSRDVIVQSDVFDKVDDISFVTGGEDRHIGECPFDKAWIYNYYGKDVLQTLSDEWIACAGISLGPREIVLAYLRAVTQEIERHGTRLLGLTGDQAIHNYLIRTNALDFPVEVTKTVDGIIGTLNYFDRGRLVFDSANNISIDNGVTPSIIHQYDRLPELSEHVAKIYGP
jgi:hypothetical protein